MHTAGLRSFFRSLRYKRALVVIAAFLVGVSLFRYYRLQLAAIDAEIKEAVVNIKNEYGVDVYYHFDRETFFPPEYSSPALKPAGAALSQRRIRRTFPLILNAFLAEYPKHVVEGNLTAIYLLGKLEFKGKRYGGTYLGSNIYIDGSSSPDHVLGTLHAELSSILFHKYEFPKEEWAAISGSRYLSSHGEAGYRMVDDPNRSVQTEDLLSNGFLTNFSRADLENDFNTYAAWAFTKPQELGRLASKYEKVKTKKDLVVRFYKSIDARINIPSRRISTGGADQEPAGSIFGLIVAVIGYPALAVAGIILHLKLRRASTLIFALGSLGSFLAFALKVFGGITTGFLSPVSFLAWAVGLLWLAIDLRRTQR